MFSERIGGENIVCLEKDGWQKTAADAKAIFQTVTRECKAQNRTDPTEEKT